jgi:hypothetical protein
MATNLFVPQPPDLKRWTGLIAAGLVLGEAIWLFIAALTRDVIVPALAMAMGSDTTSPLSLGKQDFNVPDMFMAVLQLCLAGIVAVLLNAWVQKKPRLKAVKGKSLSLTPAVQQPAPSVAQSAPGVAKAPTFASPPSSSPMDAVTEEIHVPAKPVAAAAPPATLQAPAVSGTVVAATAPRPVPSTVAAPAPTAVPPAAPVSVPTPTPIQPQAATAKPAPAAKPTKPKKPKEVYYNIVGERISPDDDDTSDR